MKSNTSRVGYVVSMFVVIAVLDAHEVLAQTSPFSPRAIQSAVTTSAQQAEARRSLLKVTDWERVLGLKQGMAVEITTKRAPATTWIVLKVSDETLTVTNADNTRVLPIPRADVVRVEQRIKQSSKFGATVGGYFLGALAGGLTAAGIAALAGADPSNVGPHFFGSLLGGVGGAIYFHHRAGRNDKVTIYKR